MKGRKKNKYQLIKIDFIEKISDTVLCKTVAPQIPYFFLSKIEHHRCTVNICFFSHKK